MSDGYLRHREAYGSISGDLAVTTATNDTTLVVAKPNYTIFVQRLIVFIMTDAAQSISFEDSNAPAKAIAVVPANPGAGSVWPFDFGSRGVPLTEGKNFIMNVSGVGLGGHVEWEGYQKLTGPDHA